MYVYQIRMYVRLVLDRINIRTLKKIHDLLAVIW
jgi:hypothetical protein